MLRDASPGQGGLEQIQRDGRLSGRPCPRGRVLLDGALATEVVHRGADCEETEEDDSRCHVRFPSADSRGEVFDISKATEAMFRGGDIRVSRA